jgi:hypothetical protein
VHTIGTPHGAVFAQPAARINGLPSVLQLLNPNTSSAPPTLLRGSAAAVVGPFRGVTAAAWLFLVRSSLTVRSACHRDVLEWAARHVAGRWRSLGVRRGRCPLVILDVGQLVGVAGGRSAAPRLRTLALPFWAGGSRCSASMRSLRTRSGGARISDYEKPLGAIRAISQGSRY